VSVRQILVDWTTINGGGKVSVTYWDNTASVATQRSALHAFLSAYMGACDNSTSYTIRTTGVELSEATGALIGAWSETSSKTDSGDQTDEPVPDAVMALARLKTATIFGGRFVQGRIYLPGLDQEQIVGGNLGSSAQTAINNAGTTLAASAGNLVVWSRPLKDPDDGSITRAGVQSDVTSITAWSELAVLRRRRN
jgi:hypothetical protein